LLPDASLFKGVLYEEKPTTTLIGIGPLRGVPAITRLALDDLSLAFAGPYGDRLEWF
jgi:hypothetical protein